MAPRISAGDAKRRKPTDLVESVVVSNIRKPKVTVEAYEPSCEAVQELGERWMDVKVVLSPNVLAGKSTEMNLVEPGAVSVALCACCERTHTTWSGCEILQKRTMNAKTVSARAAA